MSSLKVCHLVPFVVMMLIIPCDGKAEIGDYIVDCSACNYLPLTRVDSYHCNVRCDVEDDTGQASVNLTTLYDVVTKLSKELVETKKKLEANENKLNMAEEKLNATEEKLKIDVSFYAQLGAMVSVNAGDKIMFTNVITNVGDAYDDVTGIFTAPYNGTYTFTLFSIATGSGHRLLLLVNGVILSRGHGNGEWRTGGCTLNKKLVVGDQVWAETTEREALHGGYTMFSGNIIHVDI